MKTMYVRDVKDKSKGINVITLVSEFDKKGGFIKFAFAVCSKSDLFVKKIGREIALRRYNNIGKEFNGILNPDDFKFSGVFKYTGTEDHVSITSEILKHVGRLMYADQQLKRIDEKEDFFHTETKNSNKILANIKSTKSSYWINVKNMIVKIFKG